MERNLPEGPIECRNRVSTTSVNGFEQRSLRRHRLVHGFDKGDIRQRLHSALAFRPLRESVRKER
jgi:hypothetical protein